MGSRYLNMIRGQRYRKRGELFTAKSVLGILAIVAMCGSAIYWWGVQSQLTNNTMMAVAFTAILVLAPPVLTSFLIPWSPGGMLLQKINAKTWGYAVIIMAALYLIYYSFEIQYSWWATQQVVVDTGLVLQQVMIGIIGFIIIPALLWTPVTSEELVEQVRQAHLVKRYELQTQADIAILRETLLRAQEKALKGFASLTVQERQELSDVMKGLVTGIDKTLQDIGKSVKTVSGATVPFDSLEDNEDIREYLDYIQHSLMDNTLHDEMLLPDGDAGHKKRSSGKAPRQDYDQREQGGARGDIPRSNDRNNAPRPSASGKGKQQQQQQQQQRSKSPAQATASAIAGQPEYSKTYSSHLDLDDLSFDDTRRDNDAPRKGSSDHERRDHGNQERDTQRKGSSDHERRDHGNQERDTPRKGSDRESA